MTYKLFIDDERFPVTDDWIIARSSEAAIQTVQLRGMPREISFDHDLGENDTSRVFVYWLIDAVLDKLIVIPENFTFFVHSQNSVGAEWIRGTMKSFLTHVRENT